MRLVAKITDDLLLQSFMHFEILSTYIMADCAGSDVLQSRRGPTPAGLTQCYGRGMNN